MSGSFSISRRTMLRGLGATVALPWLEAMTAAAKTATGSKPPLRMVFLFMPDGALPRDWTPAKAGDLTTLPQTLAPLEPRKRDLLVLSGLWHGQCQGSEGHYTKTASFLTGTQIRKTTGADLSAGGVSVDQLAARTLGRRTPLPTLHLGSAPVRSGIDANVGYTRIYASHISWKGPDTPVPNEIDPQAVFDRLFRPRKLGGGEGLPPGADECLLDLVRDDARQLSHQLGLSDRHKLTEYLEAIRSIEQRLTRLAREDQAGVADHCRSDTRSWPAAMAPHSHAERVRLMLDLIVLALKTDSTRVVTFMLGNSVSNIDFSFLDGVRGSHHEMSHHGNQAAKMAQYQRITRWHVEQYAYLLEQLHAIREGDETLLDHTMVLFGSGIFDGHTHDARQLPILLAGRGGQTLQTGRHLVFSQRTPLCNLYHAMLERAGVKVDRFGDSTGALPGLG